MNCGTERPRAEFECEAQGVLCCGYEKLVLDVSGQVSRCGFRRIVQPTEQDHEFLNLGVI